MTALAVALPLIIGAVLTLALRHFARTPDTAHLPHSDGKQGSGSVVHFDHGDRL